MADDKPDLLEPLRKLLDSPELWTQHTFARDSNGDACQPRHKSAACWDLNGAMLRVRVARSVLIELRHRTGSQHLAKWNDAKGRTFAQVQGLLKEPFYG